MKTSLCQIYIPLFPLAHFSPPWLCSSKLAEHSGVLRWAGIWNYRGIYRVRAAEASLCAETVALHQQTQSRRGHRFNSQM